MKTRHPDANPHLPLDTIGLDAFNLIVGATFMVIDEPDPRVWVVERVVRDEQFEIVSVWVHDGTNDPDLGNERAYVLGYCTKVALVGLVVNADDNDDNNWGAN